MDLLATLQNKIDALPDGDYSLGLQAVLGHIRAGFAHLTRGQEEGEDTLFMDAIYRMNQAFEGSVKEAYRVLAGKDPSEKTPDYIEKYLGNEEVLRDRVLKQFTNYRKEWRNKSTHDYTLGFDESEAFLAIASVSAFACVLIDQISERLSHEQAKARADAQRAALQRNLPEVTERLHERVVALVYEFDKHRQELNDDRLGRRTENEVLGELTGFFASLAPDINIHVHERLDADRRARPDMMFRLGAERVLLELKRPSARDMPIGEAVAQIEKYVAMSGVKNAILYLWSAESGELALTHSATLVPDVCLTIMQPR